MIKQTARAKSSLADLPSFRRAADGAIVSPQQRCLAAQYRFVAAVNQEAPRALKALGKDVYPPFVALCQSLNLPGSLNVDDMLYKLQSTPPEPDHSPKPGPHSDWFNSAETQAKIARGELKLCGPPELMALGLMDDPRYHDLRKALRAWIGKWRLHETWFLHEVFWIFDMCRRYGPAPTPSKILELWHPGIGGVVTDWLNPSITLQWRQDLQRWPEFEKSALKQLRAMRDQSLAKALVNGYTEVGVLSWKYFRALARHIALGETFEALAERLDLEDSRSLRREVTKLRKIARIAPISPRTLPVRRTDVNKC